MDRKHRIIIAHHRPWQRWALVGGGALLLALGGWGLYSYTRATTVSGFERARLERDQLLEDRRSLARDLRSARVELDKLHDQVAYLTRSQEIDGNACSALKQSVSELQAQASDLREQLAFYRGIVSPKESQAGVRVYDFKVSRGSQSGAWRYDLVLIQSVHHDRRVAGALEVVFEGLRGGDRQNIKLSELNPDERRNLVFSFKYFEEFSGTFRLPEGFKPLRATVRLEPDNDADATVEDEYDWGKIVQESRSS
jgi:hypothetical protein